MSYKDLTLEEKILQIQEEIADIETIQEPTNEELIEFAREIHPYYIGLSQLDVLIAELERLQELVE